MPFLFKKYFLVSFCFSLIKLSKIQILTCGFLRPALVSHANTQSPDVIAYLPIEYIQTEFLDAPALLNVFR